MKLFLAAIAVLVSFVHSAPAGQYFIYSPALTPAPSVYKLPGTIVQTTAPLKLSDNGKQILYYYPSTTSALTYPYQLLSVRDDGASPGGGFDFWQVIQNWFGQAGGQGESGASGESGAAPEASSEAMKFIQSFELLDKDGKKMPDAMKKEEMKKYFFLTNQPQFLGSYVPLSPFSPIYTYQPLTAITGRSHKFEPVPVEQPVLAVEQAPQVVPEAIPLIKAVEPVVDPIVVVDSLVAASSVQEKVILAEAPVHARSALEAEKEMMVEMIAEKEMEEKAEEGIKTEKLKEELKIEQKKLEGNS